jgi:uncharacterized protein (TIGR04255 family)
MGAFSKLELKADELFPHLPNAPITEAVIEIRTRAEAHWEEGEIQPKLRAALPDYPGINAAQRIQQAFVMGPGQIPQQSVSDLGWQGLQFRTADNLNIGGFYRESFVFSRLQPYTSWDEFTREAFRLWEIHVSVARPTEIQRVGLRFINQVDFDAEATDLGALLRFPPQAAEGFDAPFNFFFHQDNLSVPGHPYTLTLNRVLQPKQEQGGGQMIPAKLILDIDVSTTSIMGLDMLKNCLWEMRWLKNKAFFGNFTEAAIKSFK